MMNKSGQGGIADTLTFMGSLNVLKEGVFNGIEMASKKGFGSKDLLT